MQFAQTDKQMENKSKDYIRNVVRPEKAEKLTFHSPHNFAKVQTLIEQCDKEVERVDTKMSVEK